MLLPVVALSEPGPESVQITEPVTFVVAAVSATACPPAGALAALAETLKVGTGAVAPGESPPPPQATRKTARQNVAARRNFADERCGFAVKIPSLCEQLRATAPGFVALSPICFKLLRASRWAQESPTESGGAVRPAILRACGDLERQSEVLLDEVHWTLPMAGLSRAVGPDFRLHLLGPVL